MGIIPVASRFFVVVNFIGPTSAGPAWHFQFLRSHPRKRSGA